LVFNYFVILPDLEKIGYKQLFSSTSIFIVYGSNLINFVDVSTPNYLIWEKLTRKRKLIDDILR